VTNSSKNDNSNHLVIKKLEQSFKVSLTERVQFAANQT